MPKPIQERLLDVSVNSMCDDGKRRYVKPIVSPDASSKIILSPGALGVEEATKAGGSAGASVVIALVVDGDEVCTCGC